MAKTSTSWKPGQSGNPTGRPKGSRNKLGEAVIDDVLADWQAHGGEVIQRVREESPAVYLRVVASLLPRVTEAELRAESGLSLLDLLLAANERDAARKSATQSGAVTEE